MDLRRAFNAISDVVVNRPPPLRVFDQIYMKTADMLIQAEHVSKWLHDRSVVFIGDGDALALCIMHLYKQGELTVGPKSVHVLDFDERVVNSVHRFAERYELADRVTASLYNVADALPPELVGQFGAFYTNPPFGSSNDGLSVTAFVSRGMLACADNAMGCLVVADCAELPWCDRVLAVTQRCLLEHGFVVAEMIPRMHGYHLDDEPNLTSCSLVGRRQHRTPASARNHPLTPEQRNNFYGNGTHIPIRYVRDDTNGGKMVSRDHHMESFENE